MFLPEGNRRSGQTRPAIPNDFPKSQQAHVELGGSMPVFQDLVPMSMRDRVTKKNERGETRHGSDANAFD